MIPYGRQHISEEDIQAVVEVLRSDFLTQGPAVPGFENALCGYTGAKAAVAVNSATSALHLACRALELGHNDYLWTSPISFVASANCGLYCGAQVDFVDIDPGSFNLCPLKLEQKLIAAEKQGKLPKIVIPVHMSGQPCDMLAIAKLAKKYGFKIIEDASHALGASYANAAVGSCHHSDITVFSFHPVKMITCGEGGAALTNDSELANAMRRLRNHGITRNPREMTCTPDGGWYYQQIDLGYNYRLSDIHAALGTSQLSKLTRFVAKRRQLARRYESLLAELPLSMQVCQHSESSYHLFSLRVPPQGNRAMRDELYEWLRGRGIAAQVHYIPIHTQPFFQARNEKFDLPEAESYYQEALTIPLYVDMNHNDQQTVRDALNNFYRDSRHLKINSRATTQIATQAAGERT